MWLHTRLVVRGVAITIHQGKMNRTLDLFLHPNSKEWTKKRPGGFDSAGLGLLAVGLRSCLVEVVLDYVYMFNAKELCLGRVGCNPYPVNIGATRYFHSH